jgi:hypothetical protein
VKVKGSGRTDHI